MSAALALARPSTAPRKPPAPARHIQIVTTGAQRRARPSVAYAVVTVTSLFAMFAAQLLLSIVVSDGAFQISSLQDQQKSLTRSQDALGETLHVLQSSQNLSSQAAHLGMVPNGAPLAIDLSTGEVYGLPGSSDPMGCGGGCNLITNSLVAGIPLVTPATAAAAAATPGGNDVTSSAPLFADSIPAPVTR